MSNSLQAYGCSLPTRLLYPWNFPGKSTGVGCHFLLQGLFSTQGSNLGLPYCRQTLYRLSHQGRCFFKYLLARSSEKPDGRQEVYWTRCSDLAHYSCPWMLTCPTLVLLSLVAHSITNFLFFFKSVSVLSFGSDKWLFQSAVVSHKTCTEEHQWFANW